MIVNHQEPSLSLLDEIKELAHKIEGAVDGEAAKTAAEGADAPIDPNPVSADPTDPVADPQPLPAAAQPLVIATNLAQALQDILPSHWEARHPSADIYARARQALDAFQESIKKV
jgi:hypothetical protein